jgi:hypothetical protein
MKRKKSYFFVYSSIFILFLSESARPLETAIIADHNAVQEFDNIPQQWIDQVKTMFLVHTGQSHGLQVPMGLQDLNNDAIVVDEDYPPGSGFKVSRSLRSQYNNWYSSIGPDRFWEGEAGKDYVRRTLNYYANNGVQVNAILHTWCWHFRSWSESQVNDYFVAMEILEAEYPDIIFIYMTDTADRSGDTNRYARNEQVRQYCRSHDKILFDFGEMETWSANGLNQNWSGGVPYWHSDWSSGSSNEYGHINQAGAIMKAKAMWWLLARIAGWNNPSSSINDSQVINERIPKELTLDQNYPNPFNPVTIIRYGLPSATPVVIDVFNMLGQKITTLVNENKTAGYYELEFNANQLASGVYIYTIRAGEYIKVMKMVIMK